MYRKRRRLKYKSTAEITGKSLNVIAKCCAVDIGRL